MAKNSKPRKVQASMVLLHQSFEGTDVYALPTIAEIDKCAGKPDGTPCGLGCRCIAQQPYYTSGVLQDHGIMPQDPANKL